MKMEDETNKPILKIGDKIRIKSKEWFDSQDKTVHGSITPPKGQPCYFSPLMSKYCGEICTIKQIRSSPNTVKVNENIYNWDSWMFDIVESAHEYKVGDKVRIKSKEWFDSQYKSNREDIEPPEEYNRPFFDFMEQYCGNICTIKYIYSNNVIKFNENDEDWESWMFDLVEEEKKEEPQYKAGDKIVINSRDWYNASKDGFGSVIIEGSTAPFIEGMEKYCGKVCTIKESFKRDKGIYYYLEEIGYVWQSWMFSSAKESTKEESKKRRPFFRRDPQTGDTIKSPYFNGIIIGENNDKDAFLILTTPYFYKQWLDKDVITEIDGYGRYLYDIDTNECDLDIRADKFRKYFMSSDYYTEKVTTSEEQLSNNKDNDSQSNSSKFDLSRVIYRSRRIK